MTLFVIIVISTVFFFIVDQIYAKLIRGISDLKGDLQELKKLMLQLRKEEGGFFGKIDPVTGFPPGFLNSEDESVDKDIPKEGHNYFKERYGHLVKD
jgi:hypothetical protein